MEMKGNGNDMENDNKLVRNAWCMNENSCCEKWIWIWS